MANDLDLLSVLSEAETRDLSHKIQVQEARKKQDAEQRKAERTARLEELGLLQETTTDWIPQETVTFWRRWHCRCGSTFEGPAYDCNPTFVRLERMRVRYFSVHHREFREFATPRPTKTPTSVYRRADYSVNLPYRIEYLDTQLWSCPKCKTACTTTPSMNRPWSTMPADDVLSMSPEAVTAPSKPIPTYGELEDIKTSPQELTDAYEAFGLSEEIET